MALEPMKWDQASSQVDFGYTDLSRVPAVTEVSF